MRGIFCRIDMIVLNVRILSKILSVSQYIVMTLNNVMKAHSCRFILFYHAWGPAWIEIHWNNICLSARSHMASHYTWGSMTALHDFGGVYVGMAFGHFLLGSHKFMVIACGSCVKWPEGRWVLSGSIPWLDPCIWLVCDLVRIKEQTYMCLKEIGLRFHILIPILRSTLNSIGRTYVFTWEISKVTLLIAMTKLVEVWFSI